MVNKVSKYKGFEIWCHDKNELTSQTVYTIKGLKNFPDIPGLRKSERAAKNLINKTLRSNKKLLIENYNNTDIFFDFRSRRYFTEQKNSEERAKTARTKEEIIKWIDQPNQNKVTTLSARAIKVPTLSARAIKVPTPGFSSGPRESFKNPRTGRISRLRSGTPRYKKAVSEGWEKIARTRVQEKTYRGYKGWRVEDGWKTEITGEEVFRTWNLAASAITKQYRKNKLTSI